MLKISWKDKVKNTEVLSRIAEVEPQFYRNIADRKWLTQGTFLEEAVG